MAMKGVMSYSAGENDPNMGSDLDILTEAPYYQVINQAPIPVLIAREDGQIVLVNEAFQTSSGLGMEEIPTIDALSKFIFNSPESNLNLLFQSLFDLEKALKPLRITLHTEVDPIVWTT